MSCKGAWEYSDGPVDPHDLCADHLEQWMEFTLSECGSKRTYQVSFDELTARNEPLYAPNARGLKVIHHVRAAGNPYLRRHIRHRYIIRLPRQESVRNTVRDRYATIEWLGGGLYTLHMAIKGSHLMMIEALRLILQKFTGGG
jgi:hypothetical protein